MQDHLLLQYLIDILHFHRAEISPCKVVLLERSDCD